MSTIKNSLNSLISEKNNKLTPENIRNGVTIFGITGTVNEGINTFDADATADDIAEGKTAYINNVKVTGTSTRVQVNNQIKTVYPSTSEQEITPDPGYTGLEKVIVNKVTNDIDVDIKPEYIKSGVDILGVTGILEKDDQIYFQESEPENKTGLWVKPTENETFFTSLTNGNYVSYSPDAFIKKDNEIYFINVFYNTVRIYKINNDGTMTQTDNKSYENATISYKDADGTGTPYHDGYFCVYASKKINGSNYSVQYTNDEAMVLNETAYFAGGTDKAFDSSNSASVPSNYFGKMIAITINSSGEHTATVKMNSTGYHGFLELGIVGTRIYYCAATRRYDGSIACDYTLVYYNTSTNTITNTGITLPRNCHFMSQISENELIISSIYESWDSYRVNLSSGTITAIRKINTAEDVPEDVDISLAEHNKFSGNYSLKKDNIIYYIFDMYARNYTVILSYDITNNKWKFIRKDADIYLIQSSENYLNDYKFYVSFSKDNETHLGILQFEFPQDYGSSSANYNSINIGNNLMVNLNDVYYYKDNKVQKCDRYVGNGTTWTKINN